MKKSKYIAEKFIMIFVFLATALLFFVTPVFAESEDAKSFDEKLEEFSTEIDSLLSELESQANELSRIQIHGDVRTRFKNTTHSNVPDPIGPYGESLTKGLKLNHRMKLELKSRISERLSAGGMIRLSNEARLVFDTGPEKLSSDRGSVFVKYDLHKFSWTLGYYDAYFTPLTLMRWDMEDNPEGGGASRCAVCPSEGGAITAESLEELAPNLTFEGSKISADLGENVNVIALIARPRIAQERETFQQYLYGVNTKLLSYHKPSASFRWLGLTAISIQDDEKSVESTSRILYSPVDNKVYGFDFNLPVGKPLLLKGEFASSRLLEKKPEGKSEEENGNAIMLSVLVKYPYRLATGISYLRIDPKYKSVYNALSYSENNQGIRVSSSYDIIKDKLSIWMFHKWLKELESTARNAPELLKTNSIISMGTYISPMKGFFISPVYILQSTQRIGNENIEKLDKLVHNINLELSYRLAQSSSLSLKYQHVRHKDMVNEELNQNANIISVLASTSF